MRWLSATGLLALALCIVAQDAGAKPECPASPARPNITYHGGKVLYGNPYKVYAVFYGRVAFATQDIVRNYIKHLGGSSYFGIISTYHDEKKRPLPNALSLAAERVDEYKHGRTFSETDVRNYFSAAIDSGYLPYDENALYAIFFAADVNVTRNGKRLPDSDTGAYHGHTTDGSKHIHYAVMPDPYSGPNAPPRLVDNDGKTGSVGGLFAINFTHELFEAITNPEGDGWRGGDNGSEVGDECSLCAYVTISLPGTKSTYSVQRVVALDGGDPKKEYCASSMPCAPANNPCAGLECGDVTDSCGRPVHCGDCKAGATCGMHKAGQCGCEPLSCKEAGHVCGRLYDACGHSIECGSCASGQTCSNGKCEKLGPPQHKCACGGAWPACRKC
jgi:hypothetical protein